MLLYRRALIWSLLLCGLLHTGRARGQGYDSTRLDKMHFRNKFINNIFQQAYNSIKRTPDANPDDTYLNGKSEDPYLPYQGRIIRKLYVETVNFDRNFRDTSQHDNSLAARVGNHLHRSTRKFVIRNNLFLQEGHPLNAYMVADNERYIRSLGYIQDARIVVDTLQDNPDSVDITIYTKDLFSIAGGAASAGLNHVNANLYDANLAGMGQRLEVTGLYDYNRNPIWGYGANYTKYNVAHSYIDASIGSTTMNPYAYTHVEEHTDFISLNRQLVSPYSRFAGALTISRSQAYNLYHIPDSQAYVYKYEYFDAWAGYNLGIRQLTATNNGIRDRRFLALRYYNRNYYDVPTQIGYKFDPIYNSSQAILAQITFFRQDYYKTQYIYGFGTTEDLPYGYNIAATVGWHKQLYLERPYAGISASRYIATSRGDFMQLFLRTGGFWYKDRIQDGSFLIGATMYSRILFAGSTKIRQYVNASYTNLYNRVTYAPLRLNNDFGPRGYLADLPEGGRRLTLRLETAFYLKLKILGFQFAPFPYGDLSLITPESASYNRSSLYTSLGGGIRARNENFVFETIEMRAYFFPIAPTNMKGFKIIVNANVRYRYSSNYITAPDVVQLNVQ